MKYILVLFLLAFKLKAGNVGESYIVVKSVGQAVTSSTTLVNDSVLNYGLEAGGIYHFKFYIPFNLAGILSGFKFAINGPVTPTMANYTIQVYNQTSGSLGGSITAGVLDTATGLGLTAIGDHVAKAEGSIIVGAAGGSLVWRFAQNLSSGSALTILPGATLQVWRVQ